MTNAAMNNCIHGFLYAYILSLVCIPRSGTLESFDNSVSIFYEVYRPFLQSAYSILHSHQKCKRILTSPHSDQCLSFFF